MADIRVQHPRFQSRQLAVRPAGLLGPKLLLDGQILKRAGGVYAAQDDAGVVARVRLKTAIDPIPKVDIDGAIVEIARPLAWYEYAWAAWPLALIALGGALGGLFGGGVAVANLHIMRKEWPAPARYAACVLLGAGAVVLWTIFASMILSTANK
jgi:hypothetical protein